MKPIIVLALVIPALALLKDGTGWYAAGLLATALAVASYTPKKKQDGRGTQ